MFGLLNTGIKDEYIFFNLETLKLTEIQRHFHKILKIMIAFIMLQSS